jgi:hypothetical protein
MSMPSQLTAWKQANFEFYRTEAKGHKQTSVLSITSAAQCYFYGVELERKAIAVANRLSNTVFVARTS